MPASYEPEKYSIDEMMDRLKNRQTSTADLDGELITRADGTLAVRVRKHKRRSVQPHKEEEKRNKQTRVIQLASLLFVSLLLVVGAGVAIVYANSTPFRDDLIRKASVSAGGQVILEQFRVNPSAAVAGRLKIQWPEGNVLREFSGRGVSAEMALSSFFGRSMTGEEVTAEEGTLIVSPSNSTQPIWNTSPPELLGSLRFNRYAIPKFHLTIGSPDLPLLRVLNAEASYFPVHAVGHPQLLLSRGELLIPTWPKMRLERSHIEIHPEGVNVVSLKIRHDADSKGLLELSGMVSPYQREKPSTLALRLESFLLSGLIGPDLGRIFNGRVDTANTPNSDVIKVICGPATTASLSVNFRNSLASPFELSGFPFLVALSQTLDDVGYERPVFESDATGMIRRADGHIILSELVFENRARMAIRGSITVDPQNRLSGDLRLGLPESAIKSARNRNLKEVFGPLEENFRWVTLKISGTAAAPQDNFLALLENAKNNPMPVGPSEIPSFEQLTAPE